MFEVIVNGAPTFLERTVTIAELLPALGYTDFFVAVAIDGALVSRGDWGNYCIKANCRIEILAPLGGG